MKTRLSETKLLQRVRDLLHIRSSDGTSLQESAGDAVLVERSNMGNWMEARIHSAFTTIADDMFGSGYLTREERIILSSGIGSALDAFNAVIQEKAPHLYQRRPYDEPEEAAAITASEATEELDSETLGGDFVPLVEAAVRRDGTIPVKIIQPGWGATGYYPADVLERDGPQVFQKGLQMFWNHATMTEIAERPEGDLHELAAELVSNARWQKDHPAGAGLYADAKVFEAYKPAVDELAPHIGVSIRADGKALMGEAEGKPGKIITAITAAKSVDFVTKPGAGGQILQLFEARGRQNGVGAAQQTTGKPVANPNVQKEEAQMDEKEFQTLKEANTQLTAQVNSQNEQIARLREGALLREAGEFVAVELAAVELPQITKNRLLRDLAGNPPVKDGGLDRETYKTKIAEAVKAETAYLVEVTGAGRISGMGSTQPAEPKPEDLAEALTGAFLAIGLSESTAKLAAKGR
jgi:hypothetical protein